MVLLCFLATNTTETPGSITVANSRQKQVPLQLSGKRGCSTNLGTENPCKSCLLFMVEFTVIEEYVLIRRNYVPCMLIWLLGLFFPLLSLTMLAHLHYPLYL